MQKEERSNKLYKYLDDLIPEKDIEKGNKDKSWEYGYNPKWDVVVISKSGKIGRIIEIQNLKIALPALPDVVYATSELKKEQKWKRVALPEPLKKIKSRNHWKQMSSTFKSQWVSYINEEFSRREDGYWFMNNGKPTYITGSHYFYLQWASIDVGYPDYRDANRILFYFWEACKADYRSYGMIYLKIRRSGFSFMASTEGVNIGTLVSNGHVGMVSKTGKDASSMFTKKVVPINSKLPFFFKPIMDGMDKPKTELSYAIPATKITRKNMLDQEADEEMGLDTVIDWRNTDDNAYDSEKLVYLIEDEAAKVLAPNNIKNGWRVRKTCLRLGGRIIGKAMMGSTSNALSKGGQNYKDLYEDSNVLNRNDNGETKSGLYALFIPMEYNTEGFIDEYGKPVLYTPKEPTKDSQGRTISKGAIDWWEAEVKGKKGDSEDLNEFYRQFPRTESHAFRDEAVSSTFNLTKIYAQIDYNDAMIGGQVITRGNFSWENGIRDSKAVWNADPNGRFYISWFPPLHLRNNVAVKNGKKYPLNEHIGAFGCDPYDISSVGKGGGSDGSLHGLTKMHFDDAPTNYFFLEYISRPPTAEQFFEDIIMACHFYGMPVLIENNKTRLLYELKNRGYRNFSLNRPDKHGSQLSKTELELGGIPSSTETVNSHGTALQSYIEKYIGYDIEGRYRDPELIGSMHFTRTLLDWAKFNISEREKFDASISSGLAIMACNRHLYVPEVKQSKISINFARYDNSGTTSRIIREKYS